MSDRGVFAVDRGVFEHPFFAREPYTQLQAWLWLLSSAAWRPGKVRAGRRMVELARGQLCFSERFLAEKWMWPKTNVRRFIRRLESEAMVCSLADREATHITICNYDDYQFGRTTDGPQGGPPTGPQVDHRRTKEEETKKVKKEESTSLRSVGRATRLPDGWTLSPDDLAFARTVLPESRVTTEFDRFCDHWHSANGSTAVKRDWSAAWRNWCRRAADMQRSTGPPLRRPNGTTFAAMLAEDLRAAHEQPPDDPEPSFDLRTDR